ncbi:MAG: polysaccharide deacetylase family protein [Hydrogenothermaceae bacterium]|nr:polysaccharide deacetylase family protein [Hydrogenothermaceae bacterium]
MSKIFIIYYHHILKGWGPDVYYKTFDREVSFLKSRYRIITLDDVFEYISSGKLPERDCVAVTFDDGYLSNYVYAYPILKKHGVRATVFPISSRILREETVRPSLEDYWKGKVSFRELHKTPTMAEANLKYLREGRSEDFLSVGELLRMKDVFDIGGHASVHCRVFYQEKLEDFFDGKNGHWSFLYAYEEEPQIGFPIFPSRNNIAVKRGFLRREVKDFIKSIDKEFFKQKGWKEVLREELSKNFTSLLCFETEEEKEKRVYEELQSSKRDLESLLGVRIYHFAYPFGHYDDKLVEITSRIFRTGFTTEKGVVKSNTSLLQIPRIAVAKDIGSFIGILLKVKFIY